MDLKLSTLRTEVKQFKKSNPRLTRRLQALIDLVKFYKKWGVITEADRERIAARHETSGRTLYRWEESYKRGGCVALTPKASPGRPPVAIRGWTAKRIRGYRKLYQWGAEVIQAHLKLDHGIKVTRYAINAYLRKKGLLKTRKTVRKKSKHDKIVQVEHPGQHTQTDVKHLPHLLPNPKKCYVYNFVDHASKWAFKRAYDSYGPSETRDFMRQVIGAAPFPITRSQTDNGIEFTYKYVTNADEPRKHALDEICEANGIRHVLIPPGEKELQGLVERSHRQDDEELYHRITPRNLEEFNRLLDQHCRWRNERRRRKSLGWRTSNQFIAEYRAKVIESNSEPGPDTKIHLQDKDTEEAYVELDIAA
jgi:transposase InsO family protein